MARANDDADHEWEVAVWWPRVSHDLRGEGGHRFGERRLPSLREVSLTHVVERLRRFLDPPKTEATVAPTTPAAVNLLWDEGQRRLAAQMERLSQLDAKTTPLLGFGIAAVAFFQTNAESFGQDLAHLGTALAALGLLATLAAVYPRTVSYVPKFRTLLEDGKHAPEAVKVKYLGNIRTALANNDHPFEVKTRWFKTAIWLYVATIVFTIAILLVASLSS